jgi:hypothetical protein
MLYLFKNGGSVGNTSTKDKKSTITPVLRFDTKWSSSVILSRYQYSKLSTSVLQLLDIEGIKRRNNIVISIIYRLINLLQIFFLGVLQHLKLVIVFVVAPFHIPSN